jgi:Ca2+-binding EF-hand superfamily protein
VFRTFDRDSDNMVSFDEWVNGLSVFLRGTVDEQLQCCVLACMAVASSGRSVLTHLPRIPAVCFNVYDLNGDGYISKEEMFQLLQKCLVKVGGSLGPGYWC